MSPFRIGQDDPAIQRIEVRRVRAVGRDLPGGDPPPAAVRSDTSQYSPGTSVVSRSVRNASLLLDQPMTSMPAVFAIGLISPVVIERSWMPRGSV